MVESHKTIWTNVDVIQMYDALFNVSIVFGTTKIPNTVIYNRSYNRNFDER